MVLKQLFFLRGDIMNKMFVVLKLSGAGLKGNNAIDIEKLKHYAGMVLCLINGGYNVSTVVGGGNIARKKYLINAIQGSDEMLDQAGMMAAAINSMLLAAMIKSLNGSVRTTLMSPIHIRFSGRENPYALDYTSNIAKKVLSESCSSVLIGGTGRLGVTTDTAAAELARDSNSKYLIKVTNVPGVFDKNPAEHNDAKLLTKITFDYAIENKLGIMDQQAYETCKESKTNIIVCQIDDPIMILKALSGELGTLIHI